MGNELQFELRRLSLFIHHLTELSLLINKTVDFRGDLKKVLLSSATYINAGKGILYVQCGKPHRFFSFGFSDSESRKLRGAFRKSASAFFQTEWQNFFQYRSIVVEEFRSGETAFGGMFFFDKETRTGITDFSETDKRFIKILAEQISLAFSKLTLFIRQESTFKLLDSVLNTVRNGIIATDRNLRILTANLSAAEMFGQTTITNLTLPDLLPKNSPVRRFTEEIGISGEGLRAENLLLSARSGKVVNIVSCPLTIQSTDNEVSGILFSLEDVSELQNLKENFSRYVNKDVVEQVVLNKQKSRLGGERIEAAVFFSDIRGFTSMSEKASPEEIVETLNQYYNLMLGCVTENNGDIDKLVGDEIMAIYRTRTSINHPAVDAVKTAVSMREKLPFFNELRREQGLPELIFGVGINFGNVVIGNIGSFKRMDYTIIGDNVNLAARLCGVAGKGQILISEAVKVHLTGGFRLNELEPVSVKGKVEPIKIYEIL